MKYLSLFTIIILITSACRKEEVAPDYSQNYSSEHSYEIFIYGTLVDSFTGNSVPGKAICTDQIPPDGTKTDAAGRFKLVIGWCSGKYNLDKPATIGFYLGQDGPDNKDPNQRIHAINLHHHQPGDAIKNVIIRIPPDYAPGTVPHVSAIEVHQ
jgi:hypothetical protein